MGAGLEGRVAIVTGGGRGVGHAVASALVAAGARVVIADNGTGIDGDGADPSVATEAAKALGGGAIAFADSVASPGAARAVVDLAVRAFGGLDIVVNNAAIRREAAVFTADPRDWEAVIRTNLSAPFYMMSAASAVMRAPGNASRAGGTYDWGRIINMASSGPMNGHPGQAADASAKAGLLALTRVAAMDLASTRITVNAIAPVARTRVTDSLKPASDAARHDQERATRLDAWHVASLVLALCGPAATSITGQLLGVRGHEVFLFGQPRPVARLASATADWTPDALAAALRRDGTGEMADLATDLDAFNTEPGA